MSLLTAKRRYFAPGETTLISVSLTGQLDTGETISSVTSVTGSPSGLTLSGQAVTTVAKDIGDETGANGNQVPIGKGITFQQTGGVAGTSYVITITVLTSNNQTKVRYLPLTCSNS